MLFFSIFLFGFQKGLWVRALSIATPDSIPRIMEVVEKMKITDIYVQVVISGSSYYNSDFLPRSQYLAEKSPPDYSPLDSIIKYAKPKGIRIHAWINTFLIWSLDSLPDSTRHIYYTHPEWLLKDVLGRSMRNYSSDDWKELGLEGTFINPSLPEVWEFLDSIGLEIIKKYDIDGIHFDFIRYPGIYWGIDDTLTAGLISGLGNRDMRWLTLLRYPRLELFNRWIVYNIFRENKKREEAIKSFLKQFRICIKNKKDDCIISCAVFASSSRASYQYGQKWWEWKSLIDYPVVMSYTTDLTLFNDFLNFAYYNFPSAVMGIGFLWKGMELAANTEIALVRKADGGGIVYFDFAALDTMADFNILLDTTMVLSDTLLLVKPNNSESDTFTIFKEVPEKEWLDKGKEYIKYGEDLEFARFLLYLSLNPDRDLSRLGLDRKGFLKLVTDDVAAFEYLNRTLGPIPDRLFEPPRRVIEYEFLRWKNDSTFIREEAKRIKKLKNKKEVYPDGINPLSRAVFEATRDEKNILETRTGIYIFKVKKIKEGRGWIKKTKIRQELLPIYIYWTIKKRFEDMSKIRKAGFYEGY